MKLIALLLTVTISVLALCTGAKADTTSLAGEWKFQLDPEDVGMKDQWFAHHDFTDTIHLPGTTDEAGKGPLTQGSDPGSLTRVHKYYGAAWYQREI